VAYLYFRGADPVVAFMQGLPIESGLAPAMLAYIGLQLPGLVLAARIVGAELEPGLQIALGAGLALLGNGTAFALIRLLDLR